MILTLLFPVAVDDIDNNTMILVLLQPGNHDNCNDTLDSLNPDYNEEC